MNEVAPEYGRTVQVVTTGPWLDEKETKDAFDEMVEDTGLFTIYREVWGYYLTRRLGQEEKKPRIDRILTPTRKLIDLEWKHGSIGVEIKKPGEKAGPVIAQMLDYSQAVWTLPVGGNVVYLKWIFLWHLPEVGGFAESILAQHRLGSAWGYAEAWMRPGIWLRNRLHFKSSDNVLRIGYDGETILGKAANGRRTGSR